MGRIHLCLFWSPFGNILYPLALSTFLLFKKKVSFLSINSIFECVHDVISLVLVRNSTVLHAYFQCYSKVWDSVHRRRFWNLLRVRKNERIKFRSIFSVHALLYFSSVSIQSEFLCMRSFSQTIGIYLGLDLELNQMQ